MALTVKKVNKLRRRGKRGKYLDRDGLYLQVMSPTNCSWLFRYELRRKKHEMGLGSEKDFPLQQARKRMREQRQLLADGIDPLAVRQQKKAEQAAQDARNKSFATVTDEYFDTHRDAWVPKHRADFLSSMQMHAYPTIGNLPVASIDQPLVLNVLRPIWMTKTPTAKVLQRRISAVFKFAIANKYRADNPAEWENLKHALGDPNKLAPVENFEAMPHAELSAFMTELRSVPGIAARALEFTIVTAARTNEVIGARWHEIDFEQRLWTVPPERQKKRKDGKEHKVPLSAQAMTLLRALARENSPYVFIGATVGSTISDNALRRTLRQLRSDGVTVHGFRATFKTWAEDHSNFQREAIEMALAHVVGNAVENDYRRGSMFEKRRRLMAAWSDFCDAPVVVSGAVTPLRRS